MFCSKLLFLRIPRLFCYCVAAICNAYKQTRIVHRKSIWEVQRWIINYLKTLGNWLLKDFSLDLERKVGHISEREFRASDGREIKALILCLQVFWFASTVWKAVFKSNCYFQHKTTPMHLGTPSLWMWDRSATPSWFGCVVYNCAD